MSGSGRRDGSGDPPDSGRLSEEDRTLHVDEVRSSGAATPGSPSPGSGTPGSGSSGGGSFGTGPGLAPGDLLAGRFRIVAFLGKGGMGEVYEAQDVELGERVAIKTLLPAIAADPTALARFRREIHLARRVTHSNVCRIFDLWRHRPAVDGGPGQEITFLTMELLAGETLTRRLSQGGRLSPDEALPIISQIAEGLTAAHQAGVVHRDFKSGNVMLVPRPEGGVRAVITDFGLARAAVGEEPGLAASLTVAGHIVGSPPYMAPEQVRGEEVGAPADLYAFGVVLYEMVTGRLPFVADSALATAAKRLSELPPPPREAAPDLPAEWEAVILRCLEREPDARFDSPLEAAWTLSGESVTQPGVPGAGRLGAWRLAAIAGAVLLLALVVVLLFLLRRPGGGPPSGPVSDRPGVAVLSFHNLAEDPEAAWLATALPELLSTDLASGTALRLVPRETVSRAELELELPDTGTLSPSTLNRLRTLLGSEYVVLGSYLAGGAGGLRLDVSLQEVTGGQVQATVNERGRQEELGSLVAGVADRLRTALGVPAGSAPPPVELATVAATRAYAEGLARLRLFDALGARDRLAAAVEADPDSPYPHAALADAWKALGYDARAEEAARRAFELAEDLSWEQRQLFAGRAQAAAREWGEAIQIYSSLWSVFPDNLEYGLLLAEARIEGGEGGAALETINELHALPPPAGEDPRIDLVEAEAARSQADYERQLAAARRAAARGEELGARLLVARGRLLEGKALERGGDFPAAEAAYRQATRLFAAAGDRVGEARALQDMAIAFAQQGNLSGARDLLEGALATYREAGSRSNVAQALSNLASITWMGGSPAEAVSLYEEALEISREVHDRRGEARELTNLARVLRQQGELEGAVSRYRRALEIWREIGDRAQTAVTLNNLANALTDQGKQAEARTLFESAQALFEEVGDRPNLAGAVSSLAEIEAVEGNLEEAEDLHRQALAIYREIGASPGVANELYYLGLLDARRGEVEAAEEGLRRAIAGWEEAGVRFQALAAHGDLARLLMVTGRPGEALDPARQVAEGFAAAGYTPGRAFGLALLAWAQAASGSLDEARKTAAELEELLTRGLPPEDRLSTAVVLARVDTLTGRRQRALERLRGLVEEVEAQDPLAPELTLEARLALGEVEVAAGLSGPGVGRSRLAALEPEAREAGYELIARRAARARQGAGG